jgi:ABC-type uncharacterized transport system permease subunit
VLTSLAALSFFIYLLLGWHFCQTRLAGKDALKPRQSSLLLAVGISCHGVAIGTQLISSTPHFGAAEALSLTAWLALIIYCLGHKRWKLDGLEPPLFAFAACFVALSLILPPGHEITYAQSALTRSHFFFAMFAQSFLFVAAGIATLMRFTDNTLHHHAGKLLARTLPPLLTLERLLFSTIRIGFALLTLALIAGSVLNWQEHGVVMQVTHKAIFGFTSWLLFAALLIGNSLRGWRGKFAANWTLLAFGLLFLGYIGSRIVLEAILHKL